MYALNFYSPIVAEQLKSGRKTATIRLGDKSAKYRKGMIVQVLTEDMASFLSQLYNREVTPDATVTVIRFSQIR
jgi:hypothetical protein